MKWSGTLEPNSPLSLLLIVKFERNTTIHVRQTTEHKSEKTTSFESPQISNDGPSAAEFHIYVSSA